MRDKLTEEQEAVRLVLCDPDLDATQGLSVMRRIGRGDTGLVDVAARHIGKKRLSQMARQSDDVFEQRGIEKVRERKGQMKVEQRASKAGLMLRPRPSVPGYSGGRQDETLPTYRSSGAAWRASIERRHRE